VWSVASAGGELVLSESFDACDEARGPTFVPLPEELEEDLFLLRVERFP